MTNPYGWAAPTGDGQQAVYFARPGENITVADQGSYGAPDQPYDNGYQQYLSFSEQYPEESFNYDPFAEDGRKPKFLRQLGERPSVSVVDATTLWLKNWRNFSGRASASEYWGVRVIMLILQALWWVVMVVIVQMIELTPDDPTAAILLTIGGLIGTVSVIFAAIPTFSLTIRRLHDTNHSGWNVLLLYLPIVSLMVSYYLTRRSDPQGWRFDDITQPLYGVDDI